MQRIFPEMLIESLNNQWHSIYLLAGQDLLLTTESKDTLAQQARLQGFDEKLEVNINAETKWEEIIEYVMNIGLFSQRKILILNLPETLNASQQNHLDEIIRASHSDLLFIINIPKISKAIEKQNWFVHLNNIAVIVNCYTPEISKIPNWLYHRAKAMNLSLEPEATQLLAFSYEGNLIALKQTLHLLALSFPNGKITHSRAKEIVENSAQFSPFQWVDALLEGKLQRAERVLQHLKNEEIQPVVLLRIIQKELWVLLDIAKPTSPILNSNQKLAVNNLQAEFARLKIWQSKQPLYQKAISRLTYKKLYRLIKQLAELERKVKQEFSDEIWFELARFSANFCQ